MWKWLILVLLAFVTTAEVYLLLTIGGFLGVISTIAWMLVSFILGVFLLRQQGVMILLKIHQQLLDEVIPARELIDMCFIGIGGILLILPGFFTDFLGIAMMAPPARWLFRESAMGIMKWLFRHSPATSSVFPSTGEVIDITPKKEPEGKS